MSGKVGKPKSPDPKPIGLYLMINEETSDKLNMYSAKRKVSRCELVREGLRMVLKKYEKRQMK